MNDRHIKYVLLASLLVNALAIGFLAGHVGREGFNPRMMAARGFGPAGGPGGPGGGPVGPNNNVDRAALAIVRQALQAERPATNKALADLAAARARSAALIRADVLDAAALDKSLADMRASSMAALESFHRSVAAAAAKLDATQRMSLARFLERAPQGRNSPMGVLGPPAAPRGMLLDDPNRPRPPIERRQVGPGSPPPGEVPDAPRPPQ